MMKEKILRFKSLMETIESKINLNTILVFSIIIANVLLISSCSGDGKEERKILSESEKKKILFLMLSKGETILEIRGKEPMIIPKGSTVSGSSLENGVLILESIKSPEGELLNISDDEKDGDEVNNG